jgi:hypothetical protein
LSSIERELAQDRHAQWKADNLKALRASGVPFEERPEACLFRAPGKPLVDFYPSTGRWRVVAGQRKTFRGGAVAFLAWYAKQGAPVVPGPTHQERAVAVLLAAGFVPDGATKEERVRIPTSKSPVFGASGGELRTLGGRARYAMPGTNVRVTVGGRTVSVYKRGSGGNLGVAFLGEGNYPTKGFTVEQLQRALEGVVVLPAGQLQETERQEEPPSPPAASADGFEVVVSLVPEEGR